MIKDAMLGWIEVAHENGQTFAPPDNLVDVAELNMLLNHNAVWQLVKDQDGGKS
jgi:hypothetical protein